MPAELHEERWLTDAEYLVNAYERYLSMRQQPKPKKHSPALPVITGWGPYRRSKRWRTRKSCCRV